MGRLLRRWGWAEKPSRQARGSGRQEPVPEGDGSWNGGAGPLDADRLADMVDEQQTSDRSPKSDRGPDRRSGEDRRKADRRGVEVPVEKDRRSGRDRRQGERRKS